MKSQRRHELQTNVLDAELSRGLDFLKNHGAKLALVILGVAILALGGMWVYKNHRAGIEQMQRKMDRWLQSADATALTDDEKKEIASGDDAQAAMATFLLGRDLLGTADGSANGPTPNAELIKDALAQAQKRFDEVISRFGGFPLWVARAHYSLAGIAVRRGNTAEAMKQYQAILDMSSLNGGFPIYTVAGEEKRRLERLTEGKGEIRLATVAPARVAVGDAAAEFLRLAISDKAEDKKALEPLIVGGSDVLAQVQKNAKLLKDSPRLEDAEAMGDKGLAITAELAGEGDAKGVALVHLVKTEGKWLVGEVEIKPAAEAKAAFEAFVDGK